MKLKIGNLEIENNIIIGPMAGVSDKAFRQIQKEISEARNCMDRSDLLKDIKKAEEIIIAVVNNSKVPVTLKMRLRMG